MSLKDNFSPEFDNPILNVSRDRLNAIDMVESALAHVIDIQQYRDSRQTGAGEAAKTVIQSEMAQPKPTSIDETTETPASETSADKNIQTPISPEEIAQMNELKADAQRRVDEIHGSQPLVVDEPDQIDDLRSA